MSESFTEGGAYPPAGKQLTYRWLIMSQVRRFADCLESGDAPYVPFAWEA